MTSDNHCLILTGHNSTGATTINTQTTLTPAEVRLITEHANNAGFDIMRYSGRCMYGRECLGLDVDNESEYCMFLIDLADDNMRLARDLTRAMTTDTLGTGYVYYFPSIAFDGFIDADDECDADEGRMPQADDLRWD